MEQDMVCFSRDDVMMVLSLAIIVVSLMLLDHLFSPPNDDDF